MHQGVEAKELDQHQIFQLLLNHIPKQNQVTRQQGAIESATVKKEDQMVAETPAPLPEQKPITFQKKQLILSSSSTPSSLSLTGGDPASAGSFENVQSTWGNILTNSVRTTGIKDGSKWRKYGQKVIKNSAFPKNYFKCTVENCPAKKYVEKVIDENGQQSIKTLYVDKHIHEGPDFLSLVILTQEEYDKALATIFTDENQTEESESVRDLILELNCNTNIETSNDGRFWRKYGQKNVKGSAFPRSYYKCTHMGTSKCRSKKIIVQVDHNKFIYTYEGRHNHPNVNPNLTGLKRGASTAGATSSSKTKSGAVVKKDCFRDKKLLAYQDNLNDYNEEEESDGAMHVEQQLSSPLTNNASNSNNANQQMTMLMPRYDAMHVEQQLSSPLTNNASNSNNANQMTMLMPRYDATSVETPMPFAPSNAMQQDPNSAALFPDFNSQSFPTSNMYFASQQPSPMSNNSNNNRMNLMSAPNHAMMQAASLQQQCQSQPSKQQKSSSKSGSARSGSAKQQMVVEGGGGYGNNFVSHPSLPNTSYFVSNTATAMQQQQHLSDSSMSANNSKMSAPSQFGGMPNGGLVHGGELFASPSALSHQQQFAYPNASYPNASSSNNFHAPIQSHPPYSLVMPTVLNHNASNSSAPAQLRSNQFGSNSNNSFSHQKMCASPSQRLQANQQQQFNNSNSNSQLSLNNSSIAQAGGGSFQSQVPQYAPNMIHYPQYYPSSTPSYFQNCTAPMSAMSSNNNHNHYNNVNMNSNKQNSNMTLNMNNVNKNYGAANYHTHANNHGFASRDGSQPSTTASSSSTITDTSDLDSPHKIAHS